MLTAGALVLGLLLDRLLGEVPRYHPLVGFGAFASRIERRLNKNASRGRGLLAWCVAVLPWVLLALVIDILLPASGWFAHLVWCALAVYFAVGWRALNEHIKPIVSALQTEDLELARNEVSKIVSRDCEQLTEAEVAKAALESLLENTSDAIIAPLFWFALAGVPGVVLYRAANTLDAMWGYRNLQFSRFGWAAARIDDLLNIIPARITAVSFALCSGSLNGIVFWRRYANYWLSPNAGPVLAAGAGALGVSLGGGARYHGLWQEKPATPGRCAGAQDLSRAIKLVCRTVVLCVVVLLAVGFALQTGGR